MVLAKEGKVLADFTLRTAMKLDINEAKQKFERFEPKINQNSLERAQ